MIDAIENSAYAIWVRESPSIWAFTTILSLHAMGLAIIVGINTIVALRLLGNVPSIPVASLRILVPPCRIALDDVQVDTQRQKHLVLILAREFASSLSTPTFTTTSGGSFVAKRVLLCWATISPWSS